MLALVVAPAPQGCPQRVDVSVPSPPSTTATLTVSACSKRLLGPWRARLGRNGVSSRHREGDGTTPLGTFGFGSVVYGIDPDPGVRLRYHRLVCGDWWDEDLRSASYNRFRHVGCGSTPPFGGGSEPLWRITPPHPRFAHIRCQQAPALVGGGSEPLWRITPAYRLFAYIRYNDAPAVRGRGSAIFLHVDTGRATNGCVSLPRAQLVSLLRRLRPGATISIGGR